MSKIRCETCKFFVFEEISKNDQGVCRYSPPPFPTVYVKDWCGQHQPKEVAPTTDPAQ